MSKFDKTYNSFLKEDESLDQWHQQKVKEENSFKGSFENTDKHEFDTLSHPIKDQLIEDFKSWIKEGEHQDGETFWDNFENTQEAAEDFVRTIIGG